MNFKKNKIFFLVYLAFIGILMGCENDDRYHYTVSYRINNQTQSLISGILKRDSLYYKNPSLEFEIEAGKTIELFTRDGGDGPNITPPYGYSLLTKELHINVEGSFIIINVEPNEKWEYRTEESTGIYTFLITETMLNP